MNVDIYKYSQQEFTEKINVSTSNIRQVVYVLS